MIFEILQMLYENNEISTELNKLHPGKAMICRWL